MLPQKEHSTELVRMQETLEKVLKQLEELETSQKKKESDVEVEVTEDPTEIPGNT